MPAPSDLRLAFRSLARRRTFAVIAVLTLALAFSIPAVVLSTVDRHFWRPLDLPGSDRLFTLQLRVEDGYFSPLSHPEYLQLREVGAEAEAFSLAAFGILDFTMVAGGAPTRVDVALVSGDFFTLLGAAPAHGRLTGAAGRRPGRGAGGRRRVPPRVDDALRPGHEPRRTHLAPGTTGLSRSSASPPTHFPARRTTRTSGCRCRQSTSSYPTAPACSVPSGSGWTRSGGSAHRRPAATPR